MTIEIKVPPLPESVTDATLVGWHKKAGESVARDENLVDLETDKVVLEVPAPASGTLLRLVAQDGATVEAGDLLAILEEGEVAAAVAPTPEKDEVQAIEPAAEPDKGPIKTSPAVRQRCGRTREK
jgi:2-oxoglutarate dehydrogenase E2 component (dihydrolipoamide succinyltransferase)